jgi:RNA polymerase sigma factor (TIGR02999 family)
VDASEASVPTPAGPPVPDAEFQRAYAHLRALAHQMLQDQRPGHTLQATALVHEAYLNVLDGAPSALSEPGRFQRVAAVAMRNILIDYARGRARQKRSGGIRQLPLDALELASQGATDDILCVDEAITRLQAERPELAELVRLRFYCGLTIEEAAKALGQSERTVYRDWTYAKALLLRELRE